MSPIWLKFAGLVTPIEKRENPKGLLITSWLATGLSWLLRSETASRRSLHILVGTKTSEKGQFRPECHWFRIESVVADTAKQPDWVVCLSFSHSTASETGPPFTYALFTVPFPYRTVIYSWLRLSVSKHATTGLVNWTSSETSQYLVSMKRLY